MGCWILGEDQLEEDAVFSLMLGGIGDSSRMNHVVVELEAD